MMATKAVADEKAAAEAKTARKGGPGQAAPKPKKSVRFDTAPTAATAGGRAQPATGLGPGRAPKRSVDDYTPPPSFYNSIERPTTQASGAISALWGGGAGSTGGR
jgi:hypothetical protein